MRHFDWFFSSIQFGLTALKVNKLRALLSLLGISIGIFAIITVFALVDSLKRNIKESIEELGADVVYVQKWPWLMGNDYPWWKYANRPDVYYADFTFLEKKLHTAEYVVYTQSVSRTVKSKHDEIEGVSLEFVSHDYLKLWKNPIAEGRYFSEWESSSGRAVGVLGHDIAHALFPHGNAIGNHVKVFGQKVTVIGIREREGNNLMGGNSDESILLPAQFGRNIMNIDRLYGSSLIVKAAEGHGLEELKMEIKGKLRTARKLRPKADDNFALNEITILSAGIESIFSILTIAGIFIGGFSILVGGFGIANIMFVSVKERTNEIGIQKSLGAQNRFILIQFLTESVVLSLIGGLAGLFFVYLIILAVSTSVDFPVFLSLHNITTGILISFGIGLISGIIPAYNASQMDPVEAIRSNG